MADPERAGGDFDLSSVDPQTPSEARMYDYFLGGWRNFAIDREAARRMLAIQPDVPLQAQANRAFLRRAVGYLSDRGIRQFLDLGSGMPTLGNVHEIAQGVVRDARVVYVDIDPHVVSHGRQLLDGNPHVTVIQQDIRQPEQVLAHPETRQLLDFTRPMAVLAVAVLHFLDDEEASRTVRTVRDALAPGSFLVVSHTNVENVSTGCWSAGEQVFAESVASPVYPRTTTGIARFFDGFTLVEPGLVWVSQWRPEPGTVGLPPERSTMLGGVGRRD